MMLTPYSADAIYPQGNKPNSNLKVVIENGDQQQYRERKDSFLQPITSSLKIDNEHEHPQDILAGQTG